LSQAATNNLTAATLACEATVSEWLRVEDWTATFAGAPLTPDEVAEGSKSIAQEGIADAIEPGFSDVDFDEKWIGDSGFGFGNELEELNAENTNFVLDQNYHNATGGTLMALTFPYEINVENKTVTEVAMKALKNLDADTLGALVASEWESLTAAKFRTTVTIDSCSEELVKRSFHTAVESLGDYNYYYTGMAVKEYAETTIMDPHEKPKDAEPKAPLEVDIPQWTQWVGDPGICDWANPSFHALVDLTVKIPMQAVTSELAEGDVGNGDNGGTIDAAEMDVAPLPQADASDPTVACSSDLACDVASSHCVPFESQYYCQCNEGYVMHPTIRDRCFLPEDAALDTTVEAADTAIDTTAADAAIDTTAADAAIDTTAADTAIDTTAADAAIDTTAADAAIDTTAEAAAEALYVIESVVTISGLCAADFPSAVFVSALASSIDVDATR
jgi:hypothetical protein